MISLSRRRPHDRVEWSDGELITKKHTQEEEVKRRSYLLFNFCHLMNVIHEKGRLGKL
jgi:hypothetical protein